MMPLIPRGPHFYIKKYLTMPFYFAIIHLSLALVKDITHAGNVRFDELSNFEDFQCKQSLVYASSCRGLTGKRKDL